jgi:hypothetical protein
MQEQEPIMAKITKRTLNTLQPDEDQDVFAWDGELRGFGVRVKPSGVKTFLTPISECREANPAAGARPIRDSNAEEHA